MPDWTKPFQIECDTSKYASGLRQEQYSLSWTQMATDIFVHLF